MEKGEKIHLLGIFGSSVLVHPSRTQSVPVQFRGVPVHPPCSAFPVSTNFRILAITCSFLSDLSDSSEQLK